MTVDNQLDMFPSSLLCQLVNDCLVTGWGKEAFSATYFNSQLKKVQLWSFKSIIQSPINKSINEYHGSQMLLHDITIPPPGEGALGCPFHLPVKASGRNKEYLNLDFSNIFNPLLYNLGSLRLR